MSMEKEKEDEKKRSKRKEEEKEIPLPLHACAREWVASKKAQEMRPLVEGWLKRFGYPLEFADKWLMYRDMTGWHHVKTGVEIDWRNFQRSLRLFCDMEDEVESLRARGEKARKRREKAEAETVREEAAKKKRIEEAAKPGAWALCRERCANCTGSGCKKGVKIPPPMWEHPQRPDQCPEYEER